jgi:hypothetical protein
LLIDAATAALNKALPEMFFGFDAGLFERLRSW